MLNIQVQTSSIKETRWYEFGLRFLFGGAVTAAVGAVSKHYGPGVGGLFLAFPSIMPAAITMLAKHEEEHHAAEGKQRAVAAGEQAAADEAIGTAIGSFGLLAFALIIWLASPAWSPALVLLAATVVWFGVAAGLWIVRHHIPFVSVAATRLARREG